MGVQNASVQYRFLQHADYAHYVEVGHFGSSDTFRESDPKLFGGRTSSDRGHLVAQTGIETVTDQIETLTGH